MLLELSFGRLKITANKPNLGTDRTRFVSFHITGVMSMNVFELMYYVQW